MLRMPVPICLVLIVAAGCSREEFAELAHEQGRFKIRMPAGHETKSGPVQDTTGKATVKHDFFFVKRDHGYFLSYTDIHIPEKEAAAARKARLETNQRDWVKNNQAAILESKHFEMQDKYPSMQFIAKLPKGQVVKTQETLVKNRLYTVQAVGDESFIKSANVSQFFDSFQIVP